MARNDLRLFRKADILVYIFIAVIAVGIFLTSNQKNEAACLLINCGGSEKTFDITRDTSFELENNGYTLTVIIENGEVFVSETDCPDRICRITGRITRPGQSIICVPAEISLTLIADGEGDYDAFTH